MLTNCNGHGTCVNTTSTCVCYDGWGSKNDVTFYRTPDCSLRVCPSDRAWADVPLSSTVAHQPMEPRFFILTYSIHLKSHVEQNFSRYIVEKVAKT